MFSKPLLTIMPGNFLGHAGVNKTDRAHDPVEGMGDGKTYQGNIMNKVVNAHALRGWVATSDWQPCLEAAFKQNLNDSWMIMGGWGHRTGSS